MLVNVEIHFFVDKIDSQIGIEPPTFRKQKSRYTLTLLWRMTYIGDIFLAVVIQLNCNRHQVLNLTIS